MRTVKLGTNKILQFLTGGAGGGGGGGIPRVTAA